jgi:uncharacterized membrane protein/gas vesicle protein
MGALAGAALASTVVWLMDPQSGRERRAIMRERASTAYERSRQGLNTASTRARTMATQGRERLRTIRSGASSSAGTSSGIGGGIGSEAGEGYGGTYGGSYGSQGFGGDGSQTAGGGSQADLLRQGQQWLQQVQGSRIATGAAGLGLAGWGLSRRGPLGLALGALGLYLVATSARQKQGASIGSGIEIENSVSVNAPIEQVWTFIRRVETWPQFMSHVREITPTGDRRYHWSVDGPAGIAAEWDAEVTQETPNERLAWRTLPGSMVDSEGSLDIENEGDGRTRITLRMIYSPPAGAAGHVVAKLFRRDPQIESREDLQNLKHAIESGSIGGATTGTANTMQSGGLGATSTH